MTLNLCVLLCHFIQVFGESLLLLRKIRMQDQSFLSLLTVSHQPRQYFNNNRTANDSGETFENHGKSSAHKEQQQQTPTDLKSHHFHHSQSPSKCFSKAQSLLATTTSENKCCFNATTPMLSASLATSATEHTRHRHRNTRQTTDQKSAFSCLRHLNSPVVSCSSTHSIIISKQLTLMALTSQALLLHP